MLKHVLSLIISFGSVGHTEIFLGICMLLLDCTIIPQFLHTYSPSSFDPAVFLTPYTFHFHFI